MWVIMLRVGIGLVVAGATALAVDQHGKRKTEQGKREVADYKCRDEQRKRKIAQRKLAAEQAKRKVAQNSAKYYEARLKEIEPEYEFLSIWFPKHIPQLREYASEIERLRAELSEARSLAA